MPTDLAHHIQGIRIADTHEHLWREEQWLDNGPRDVFQDLFVSYPAIDLSASGASPMAVTQLFDADNPDLEERWAGVAEAWQRMQFTGWGEAVRLKARLIYGMDEITPASARAAQACLEALRRPGERLRLLRDQAGLDHVQVDDKRWACEPDLSGPDFFFYDLSWVQFCGRGIDFELLAKETGVTVGSLADLRRAMETLFEKHARTAVAVKSQHAYNRSLRWEPRSEAEAEQALQQILRSPEAWRAAAGLCLGDWGLARGAELAGAYGLPFKLHTGYLAGVGMMPIDSIRSGLLAPFLMQYPATRFVLMHLAYPYSQELLALIKHFTNAYADLCWAWSIDPLSSMDFVRKSLHTAPLHKLFAFGGDDDYPTSSYVYAYQARKWLTRALQMEIEVGEVTEAEAMSVATRWLRGNQLECFDLQRVRAEVEATLAAG